MNYSKRKTKKKEKVPFKKSVKNNIFILKMTLRLHPGFVIMRFIMGIFTGLNHGISLFFVSEILNELDRSADFTKIMWLCAGMAIYTLAYELCFEWYYKLIFPRQKLDFIRKLHKHFFIKANELDLACYDTPEFYNDFVYSMRNSDKSFIRTIEQLAETLKNIIASASVFALVLTVDPIISIVILGLSLLSMIILILRNGVYFKYNLEMNEIWRKKWYIVRFFSLAEYAKEIRLSNVADNMMNEFHKEAENECNAVKRMQLKASAFQSVLEIFTCATTLFILLFLSYKLIVTGEVLIGGFTVALSASWKLRWLFTDIQNKIVQMNQDSLFADKVKTFLETETKIKSGTAELDEFKSLEFKNVSFKYKDEYVLNNVSFKISKGERIAFVGYNGAGKTTTTKLIMRLYDVTDGKILINGIDIKDYDIVSLRSKLGAVFQDYKVFAATIAENVIGDSYKESDDQTIINALGDSTFQTKLDNLENGINTELTREFYDNGTELSGGENQKIAIARVFAHQNELVIMDEPSSALDPIAEYNLNLGIEKNAKDKTVIFITHRLSTTRHVNRIYMFENGRIIEKGSHDELIKNRGKYCEMFELQAKKYRQTEE